MSVEASESFLSVDGSGKGVVRLAFDENIKKRNLLVLFKFSGELNVLVPGIEIRKKLNSGVFIGIVKIATLGKQNVVYMTGKRNISRR